MSMNRDVNVPLVKTQDGKDFDPKHKSSIAGSVASGAEPETEEAVQAQESKRRKRRILKVSVYCMFGIIAMGVFVIWLFHKDSKESLRFGSLFLFTVKLRSLEVKNTHGDGVLYGDMGKRLLATPYEHCWQDYETYEENCLEWLDVAKLYVEQYVPGNDTSHGVCYTLRWVGLSKDFVAEDCFYLQNYHWYGVLTEHTPAWPIEGVQLPDMTDYYDEYPNEQGENLVPIWYGSQGVALFVDSSFPFSLGWNTTEKRQFCIRSKLSAEGEREPRDLMRYTVCQADSIRQVYQIAQKHRQDVDTDFTSLSERHQHLLLSQPIHALTEFSDVQELLDQLQKGESQCSLFEIYDNWEESFGDLAVNRTMMPQLEMIISVAEKQGCYPILPISTFFTYRSQHFREGVANGFFVRDQQNLVTRMVQWRGEEGAVLDVTNPAAEEWFLDLVVDLQRQLGARALKLLHLSTPPDSSYHDQNMTHLDYTRIFYRDLASLNISLVLEMATGFIPLPVYTPIRTMFYGEQGSACFNTSVPYSLTMGLSGYPLLIADADLMTDPSPTMFMRWLQLAVFFPVLEVPNLPLLKNKTMQNFLTEILALRKAELLPYLSKIWEAEPTLPILRPLLWDWPEDEQAQVTSDQFMVGDRLLVAPVLCEGTTVRTVYLPAGSWVGHKNTKDIYRGPRTFSFDVKDFSVIPFFWKRDKAD